MTDRLALVARSRYVDDSEPQWLIARRDTSKGTTYVAGSTGRLYWISAATLEDAIYYVTTE